MQSAISNIRFGLSNTTLESQNCFTGEMIAQGLKIANPIFASPRLFGNRFGHLETKLMSYALGVFGSISQSYACKPLNFPYSITEGIYDILRVSTMFIPENSIFNHWIGTSIVYPLIHQYERDQQYDLNALNLAFVQSVTSQNMSAFNESIQAIDPNSRLGEGTSDHPIRHLTPLAYVAKFGSEKQAELLVKNGADPHLKSGIFGSISPLQAAVSSSNTGVFSYLYALSPDLKEEPMSNGELLGEYIFSRPNPSKAIYDHFLANPPQNTGDLIREMMTLKMGLDTEYALQTLETVLDKNMGHIHRVDDRGFTPLHTLVSLIPMLELVRPLLHLDTEQVHIADSMRHELIVKSDRQTAGQFFTYMGKRSEKYASQAIDLLVKHGANVNAKDKDGNTPLHWATLTARSDALIETLKKHGADPAIRNNNGWSSAQMNNILASISAKTEQHDTTLSPWRKIQYNAQEEAYFDYRHKLLQETCHKLPEIKRQHDYTIYSKEFHEYQKQISIETEQELDALLEKIKELKP